MFNISQMTLNDLDSIKDILSSEFDDFWNYNIFKTELENANSKYIIVKNIDNEIVGFGGIKIILDEADIMNIVTKKTFRNNGIGSMILEALIDLSKSINLKSINLEVNELNLPAIHLYSKFNFETIGIRNKYYDNTYNALIMTKKL